MSEAHCNNLAQRKALGLVTHDNTGGPFVVECHGCGSVYPSFQCGGGGQIADTGDYDDARCPHCQHVDPEECGNAGLAWNTQQLKINALQLLLNERDEQNHSLEQRRQAEQQACQAAERRVEQLQTDVERLKAMSSDPFDRMRDLQSELTKARELIQQAHDRIYANETLTAYMDLRDYLSNQSAPADKDGCAHSEANKHGCPECGEEFKP